MINRKSQLKAILLIIIFVSSMGMQQFTLNGASVESAYNWEGVNWDTWFSTYAQYSTLGTFDGRDSVLKIQNYAHYANQLNYAYDADNSNNKQEISVDFYPDALGSWSWGPALKVYWPNAGITAWIRAQSSSYGQWAMTGKSSVQQYGAIPHDRWYNFKIVAEVYNVDETYVQIYMKDITNNSPEQLMMSNYYQGNFLLTDDPIITLGSLPSHDYSSRGSWETFYYGNPKVNGEDLYVPTPNTLFNGDFEDGTLTPWLTNPSYPAAVTGNSWHVHSGSYGLRLYRYISGTFYKSHIEQIIDYNVDEIDSINFYMRAYVNTQVTIGYKEGGSTTIQYSANYNWGEKVISGSQLTPGLTVDSIKFETLSNSGSGTALDDIQINWNPPVETINLDGMIFEVDEVEETDISSVYEDYRTVAKFNKNGGHHARLTSYLYEFESTPFEATTKFKFNTLSEAKSWEPTFEIRIPGSGWYLLQYSEAGLEYGGTGITSGITETISADTWYDWKIGLYHSTTSTWHLDMAYKLETGNTWTFVLQDHVTNEPIGIPEFILGTYPNYDSSLTWGDDIYSFAAPLITNAEDRDADGLTDVLEHQYRDKGISIDPKNPDTDGDGLLDGDELNSDYEFRKLAILNIDPEDKNRVNESDESSTSFVSDGWSYDGITYYSNPLDADSDDDGLSDSIERSQGTSPRSSDTDGDGINDMDDWYPTLIDKQSPAFLDISDNIFEYGGKILEVPGPQAVYYKFNQGSLKDHSKNELHAWGAYSYGRAKVGDGLYFGDEQYVRADSVSNFFSSSFSVSLWIKPGSTQPTNGGSLFSIHDNYNNEAIWKYRTDYKIGVYIDGIGELILSSSALSPNNWYHLSFVHDGSSIFLYINGLLDFQTSYTGFFNANMFSIGFEWDGSVRSDVYNGILDEFMVFDQAITNENAREVYLRSSIAAHYKLDKNDLDNSKNDLHAILSNDVSYTDAEGGKYAEAGYFDGNDYLQMGDVNDFSQSDQFSISAWVKTTSSGSGVVVSKMKSGSPYTGYDIYISNGIVSSHLINTWSSNAIKVTGTTSINDGEWHHIAVTYDGSSSAEGLKIYVDGSIESTTINVDYLTGGTESDTPFRIGSRYLGNYFTGYIDEVRVYATILDASDIEWIMKGAISSFEGTVLYVEEIEGKYYSVFQVQDNRGIDKIRVWTDGAITNVDYDVALHDSTGIETYIRSWDILEVLGYRVHFEAYDIHDGEEYKTDIIDFYINSHFDGFLNMLFTPVVDIVMSGVDWIVDQVVSVIDTALVWINELGEKAVEAAETWIDFQLSLVKTGLVTVANVLILPMVEMVGNAFTSIMVGISNYVSGDAIGILEMFDPIFNFLSPVLDLANQISSVLELIKLIMKFTTPAGILSFAMETVGSNLLQDSGLDNLVTDTVVTPMVSGVLDILSPYVPTDDIFPPHIQFPEMSKVNDFYEDLKALGIIASPLLITIMDTVFGYFSDTQTTLQSTMILDNQNRDNILFWTGTITGMFLLALIIAEVVIIHNKNYYEHVGLVNENGKWKGIWVDMHEPRNLAKLVFIHSLIAIGLSFFANLGSNDNGKLLAYLLSILASVVSFLCNLLLIEAVAEVKKFDVNWFALPAILAFISFMLSIATISLDVVNIINIYV